MTKDLEDFLTDWTYRFNLSGSGTATPVIRPAAQTLLLVELIRAVIRNELRGSAHD